MWPSMTPLRQFQGIREEILRKIEKKEQFTWEHFYNMSKQEIGEVIKFAEMGKTIHKLIHQFPRLELKALVQPLTRSLIRIGLEITKDFEWNSKFHGRAESFHIFVEDVDGEMILHHELFILSERESKKVDAHLLSFTVSLYEPLPPQYFVRVISDRWLRCETVLPVSFKNLILPDKFPAQTEKEDVEPIPLKNLKWSVAIDYFEENEKLKEFNSIQSQVFPYFYESDESILLGAPTSSGKTACAELAILRQLRESTKQEDPSHISHGKIVYVSDKQAIVDITHKDWKDSFEKIIDDIQIVKLTGILQTDLKLLAEGSIVCCTSDQWDVISRRWAKRKHVQNVSLFIMDEIHLMSENDSRMEVAVSRMRYMASDLGRPIRFIALGSSIANYKVIGEWIGATKMFNFVPNTRPLPLDLYMKTFDHNIQPIRFLAMCKPAYQNIKQLSEGKPVMIFVPDRKHVRLVAVDLISFATSDDDPNYFLGSYEFDKWGIIKEDILQKTMKLGVGFLHEGLSNKEKQIVKKLYEIGKLKALVVVHNLCWEVGDLSCYMTLIMDPVEFDFTQNRYVEYPISEILQMIGRASRPDLDTNSKCLFFCHTPKKDYFHKFISEPIPVESNLEYYLHETINSEVVVENIESTQDVIDWITWTFMYRRLVQNPNFYNLSGKTGQHVNDHLSELIERVIDDLTESGCIKVDDDENVSPTNLGRIAAYYNINHSTIKLFQENLSENSKMKHLLEIISASEEFENLPIRESDEGQLRAVPVLEYRVDPVDGIFSLPNVKTNILLQCHFLRQPLSIDLSLDQKKVLEESLKLVQAMVDVISSFGWLKPALLAMELSQMIVQAALVKESTLFQLPHFDFDIVDRCKKSGVKDINDLIEMDDEPRKRLLQLSEKQLEDIAQVCNSIPNYTIKVRCEQEHNEGTLGQEVQLTVFIESDEEEEDEEVNTKVYAPYYPQEKDEQWWLIIADEKNNRLLSIRRVQPKSSSEVSVSFTPTEKGNCELTAMLV
jgi:pre-mRNA-splicing helicase BRR2